MCNVCYYEYWLLDVVYVGEVNCNYLFCYVGICIDFGSRVSMEWVVKLDRSWSVFDLVFRIYEVCYDYIFSEIFIRKSEEDYIF